jgi:hypothetical protein
MTLRKLTPEEVKEFLLTPAGQRRCFVDGRLRPALRRRRRVHRIHFQLRRVGCLTSDLWHLRPDDGPRGTVYRPTDGGLRWSLVSGLPQSDRYQLLTFFNCRDGVALGQAAKGSRPDVFATDNGGTRWTAKSLPAGAAIAAYTQSSSRVMAR